MRILFPDIYEQLKFNLYQDDAVTGEAAGIGMGLVMLGTKSPRAIEDMVGVSSTRKYNEMKFVVHIIFSKITFVGQNNSVGTGIPKLLPHLYLRLRIVVITAPLFSLYYW